ncbi:MAG: ion transporter, partial [Bacillota bacterium]
MKPQTSTVSSSTVYGVPLSLPERIARLVHHAAFTNSVLALIFGNALLIGLETAGVLHHSSLWVRVVEGVVLWAFTLEMVLRFVAEWPRWTVPLTSGWYLFDLAIVLSGHLLGGSSVVQVLRLLRVLRVLRVVSVVPSMQRLVGAVLEALPSMGSILLLLGLLFYVYGILGASFFGQISPDHFGSLSASFLTLFEVVTLEGWVDVMMPLQAVYPWAWLYFVSFILLGTFVVFNLFVGVIVNAMEETNRADLKLIREADETQEHVARLS